MNRSSKLGLQTCGTKKEIFLSVKDMSQNTGINKYSGFRGRVSTLVTVYLSHTGCHFVSVHIRKGERRDVAE